MSIGLSEQLRTDVIYYTDYIDGNYNFVFESFSFFLTHMIHFVSNE